MTTLDYNTANVKTKAKSTTTNLYKFSTVLLASALVGFSIFHGRALFDLNISNSDLKQEKAARIAERVKANTILHKAFRSNFTKEQLQQSDLAWEKVHNKHWNAKDSLSKRSHFLADIDTLQLGAQEKAGLKAEIATNKEALQAASSEFMEAVYQRDYSHEPAVLTSLQTKSQQGQMIVDAQLDEKTKAIHFKFEPQY